MAARAFTLGLMTVTLALGACGDDPESSAPRTEVAASSVSSPDAGAASSAVNNEMTCSYPVHAGESAKDILDRYGKDARREQLENEGGTYEAVALWPDDPEKRIEVSFKDGDMNEIDAVAVAGASPRWSVAGVKFGTTLDEVERLNGRPFKLYGLGWDFGGMIFDWNGGALGKIEGGCRVGVSMADRMAAAGFLPVELTGDRELRSDLPSLRSRKVEAIDLWISFPD